jgi:uncharacterized protein YprB with RNaseH-like and TPR domain
MNQLKSRLNTLRRQSGHKETHPQSPPDKPAIRERLQRLSVPQRSQTVTQSRCTDDALAALLGGRLIADGLILVEELVPTGTVHGRCAVERVPWEAFAVLGHKHERGHVFFMDAETTGLAGGTGTLVFLLGLARLDDHGLVLRQYFLTGFSGEAALLDSATEFIDNAGTLITYNGKSFDAPLLAARYRLAGTTDPFAALPHLDLLHPTRCAFASRWEDCRLQTAERRLIGFRRVDDLPGSLVPEAWFGWVRWGATQMLPKVLGHNRWDLVSLTALLSALGRCYRQPTAGDADILAIARHFLRRGDEQAAHRTLSENAGDLCDEGRLELARLCRRQGDWQRAIAIWHALAEAERPEALEHLAKYYEHVARDLSAAMHFTSRLQTLQPRDPAHRHRQARLQGKGTVPTALTELTQPVDSTVQSL